MNFGFYNLTNKFPTSQWIRHAFHLKKNQKPIKVRKKKVSVEKNSSYTENFENGYGKNNFLEL